MTQQTTVYYTLIVERNGTSGPENEHRIEDFVNKLVAQKWSDMDIELTIEGHNYDPVTETID